MNRMYIKKNTIQCIIMLLVALFSFTGCFFQIESPKLEYSYLATSIMGENMNNEYSSMSVFDGNVYVLVNQYDAVSKHYFYSVQKIESDTGENMFTSKNENNTYVSDLCVTGENELVLITNVLEENQPDKCRITRCSLNGSEIGELMITGHCKVIADENDTLYVIGENEDEKPLFEIIDVQNAIHDYSKMDLQVLNDGVIASDGTVILVGMDYNGIVRLKMWDKNTKQVVDYSMNGTEEIDIQLLIQSPNEEFLFYFTSYDGIYGMKKGGTVEKILDFINSDIKPSEIVTCECIDDNEFYMITMNENGSSIKHLVPDSENSDKILTLATDYYDNNLINNIIDFNRKNDEYRIAIKEYPEDKTTATNMLFSDLEGNFPPDLIFIDSFDMDMQYAATEELFTDMYKLMENDNEVNTATLMPNYQKANEVQGKLLALGYTYRVSTVVANAELTGNRTSWKFTEFLSICRSCEESGIELFDLQNSISFMDFALRGDPLIDYSNSMCHFNEAYFTDYLNFASELTVHEDPDFSNATQEEVDQYFYNEDKKYATGKRLMYITELGEYNDYLMAISMFENKPTSVIGFPTREGTDCRNYLEPSPDRLSISSESKYKQQAWQFVKQYLNSDANYVYGFPVFVDETKEFLNYNVGNNWEHLGGNIPATTQADIDQFYNFLLSADKIGNYSLSNAVFYGLIQNSDSYLMPSDQVAEAMQSECEQYLRHIN